MYQIFFSRVKLFEVSFKYLSNFIAPPVAAYGFFKIFIFLCRFCFTPNLWKLGGDRGDRNNGVSCTSHTAALSSCIFFHLSSVSNLLSCRLHHPTLIGYTYQSYRNVWIMLTYTYLSKYFSTVALLSLHLLEKIYLFFLIFCEKRLLTECTVQSHYLLLGSLIIFWVVETFLYIA